MNSLVQYINILMINWIIMIGQGGEQLSSADARAICPGGAVLGALAEPSLALCVCVCGAAYHLPCLALARGLDVPNNTDDGGRWERYGWIAAASRDHLGLHLSTEQQTLR